MADETEKTLDTITEAAKEHQENITRQAEFLTDFMEKSVKATTIGIANSMAAAGEKVEEVEKSFISTFNKTNKQFLGGIGSAGQFFTRQTLGRLTKSEKIKNWGKGDSKEDKEKARQVKEEQKRSEVNEQINTQIVKNTSLLGILKFMKTDLMDIASSLSILVKETVAPGKFEEEVEREKRIREFKMLSMQERMAEALEDLVDKDFGSDTLSVKGGNIGGAFMPALAAGIFWGKFKAVLKLYSDIFVNIFRNKHIKALFTKIGDGFKAIGRIFEPITKRIKTLLKPLDPVMDFFKIGGRKGIGVLKHIGNFFRRFGVWLSKLSFLQPLIMGFKSGSKLAKGIPILGQILMVVDATIQAVMGFFKGFKEGGLIEGLKGAGIGIFKALIGDIVNLGADLIGWLFKGLGKLFGIESFGKIGNKIKSFDFVKFIFETIPELWSKFVSWFKGLPNLIATGLVGIIPNIFGIRDWLASKLGVNVKSAQKEVREGERFKPMMGILKAIQESILMFIPRLFGIRKWIGERWGINTESKEFGKGNIMPLFHVMKFIDKLKEGVLRTILNTIVPNWWGIRDKIAKFLGVPLNLEGNQKLEGMQQLPSMRVELPNPINAGRFAEIPGFAPPSLERTLTPTQQTGQTPAVVVNAPNYSPTSVTNPTHSTYAVPIQRTDNLGINSQNGAPNTVFFLQ